MPKSPSRAERPQIEVLEQRIAPAAFTASNPITILNSHLASYVAPDGGHVYVSITKGAFTKTNEGSIFITGSSGQGTQLEMLDLSYATNKGLFAGTTVNIYEHPGVNGGSNTVNVGYINATGIDVYGVRVHGDLGRIDAGDTHPKTAAVEKIDVLSMGQLGLTTQGSLANSSLVSNIVGGARNWDIFGNFDGATILAANPSPASPHFSYIGIMDIGGSVIGGATAGSGEISATGGIRYLTIGGDLVGGSAANTGEIVTDRSILELTVNGSITGGEGNYSGTVFSPVTDHVTVLGDVQGGGGDYSGSVLFVNNMPGVAPSIPAPVTGGVGNPAMTYGGDLKVHGSVIGGNGIDSGYIQEINPVYSNIGGSIIGGSGPNSGAIYAKRGVSFLVKGSLTGGAGTNSGSITVGGDFDSATVLHDMTGGAGAYSGSIHSLGKRINTVTVGGTMTGGGTESGEGNYSGSILCDQGAIFTVSVGGSMIGGSGIVSGSISAGTSIATVSVLGDLNAGSGTQTASILSTKNIGSISIAGNIYSTAGTDQPGVQITGATNGLLGTLDINGNVETPLALTLHADVVKIAGSIESGGTAEGSLMATAINRLRIFGSVQGTTAAPANIVISGDGVTPGANAVNLLRVYDNVTNANILAGTTPGAEAPDSNPTSGSIRINTLEVGGNWTASNLAVGVVAGADGYYTDASTNNTSAIFSEIAKIVITGEASGDATPSDHYAFASQEVGSVTVSNQVYQLTPGPGNDTSLTDPKLQVGSTGNLFIHEVVATTPT